MEKNLDSNYFSQLKASFTTYINIVIKNASINYKKKSLKFIELEYNDHILKDISLSSIRDISFFDSSEENYSYEHLENYFSNYTLYKIIKNLSVCQKQVLYYKAIKNYDYAQIAILMKTSEANIRNIKSRTIKKIKDSLKGGDFYGK